SREVHEMFKTTAIDTLKQDKKCQACWYMILSTMSGSTTIRDHLIQKFPLNGLIIQFLNWWLVFIY
ncbi:MAG: hypothetical protein WBE68_27370, partial [Candidatus Nitrosopolaris sp.]